MTPFIRKIVHHWSAIPGKADDGRNLGVPLPGYPAIQDAPIYSVETSPGPYDYRSSDIQVAFGWSCGVCAQSPGRTIVFTGIGCEGDGEVHVCESCLVVLANLITKDKKIEEDTPADHYETQRVRVPWGLSHGDTVAIPDPGNS